MDHPGVLFPGWEGAVSRLEPGGGVAAASGLLGQTTLANYSCSDAAAEEPSCFFSNFNSRDRSTTRTSNHRLVRE